MALSSCSVITASSHAIGYYDKDHPAAPILASLRKTLVRDTRNRAGVILRFSPQAWRRFVGQVKADARSV